MLKNMFLLVLYLNNFLAGIRAWISLSFFRKFLMFHHFMAFIVVEI